MLLPRLIRWKTLFSPTFFSILLISLLCTALASAQAQPQPGLESKKVLILHALEGNAPVFVETDRGLMTKLEAGGVPRLNQFYESLDLRRNPGPENRRLLVERMRARYGHRKLDIIITMYPEALEFVLKDCRDIFPGVPILALYMPNGFELPKTDRLIIGHSASVDPIGTFEIALKLVPRAKRVYVVSGEHELDRAIESSVRRDLKKWENRLEFRYLSGMSFEEMLTVLSTAPPETFVLLLLYAKDVAGRSYANPSLTESLNQVSTVPMFGFIGAALGHGIVGGSLINFQHIGTKVGDLVLDILKGTHTAKNFPKLLDAPSVPMFDWRQLKRWNLSTSALPKGSIVINREVTFWDFKYYIMGGVALCLLEFLLITALMRQRYHRKKVDEALQERLRFEQLVSELSARLVNVSSDQIDAEINQALQRLANFFGASACIMVEASPDQSKALFSHGSQADGKAPAGLGTDVLPLFPWTSKLVQRGEAVRINSIDDLPEEAAIDRQSYQARGIRAVLTIPVSVEGLARHSISLSCRREARDWPERYIPRVRLLGEIIVNCLKLVRTNKRLRESEARLSLAADSAEMGVWTVDLRTGSSWGTDKQRELFGFRANENVAMEKALERIHPEDRNRFQQAMEQAMRSGGTHRNDFRIVLPDGSIRWISSRGRAHFSASGEPEGLMGVSLDITDRKGMEEALRQSDERFRVMIEESGMAIGISRKGVITYANKKYLEMFGYGNEREICGQSTQTRWTPESWKEVMGQRREGMSHYSEYEGTALRKDGSRLDVHVVFSHLELNDGPANIAFFTDITDRKKAEKALAESQAQILALFDSTDDLIWSVEPETFRLVTFNKAVKDFFLNLRGFEIQAGMTAEELLPPDYALTWRNLYERALREGSFITEYLSVTGRRYFLLSINPLKRNGNIFGISVFANDITDRKRAEEELREAERKYRELIRYAPAAIYEIDFKTNRLTSVNDAMCQMLGYSREEFLEMSPSDLLDEESRVRFRRRIAAWLQGKEPERQVEYRVKTKDGRSLDAILNSTFNMDKNGKLISVTVVAHDITERKRAEEELRKYHGRLEEMVSERTADLAIAKDQAEAANRAKSVFLANMSHELRTPLNSVLGIGQIMGRDAGFPEQYKPMLEVLSRSGRHLLELINDVLEVSKIEAGKTTVAVTSFDLHRLLSDLEEMMRPRAEKKELDLVFECDPALPRRILTDERKLRQILINFISNAIKYTEKGRVIVRSRPKVGIDTISRTDTASISRLEFEVEDTGIGIAREDMKNIFEPFVQLRAGQRSSEGVGLGLTLSRTFVEFLGGEIAIQSELGRGSTFTFDIQVGLSEEGDIPARAIDREVVGLGAGQRDSRLLVVDDSLENRYVLRLILERAGFHVEEAAGGQEAVKLFDSYRPHLIWMDLRMPGMDGFEASRRIREGERGKQDEKGKQIHTPIIAVTAGVLDDRSSAGDSDLFDDFVPKPIQVAEVFDRLEKHLGVQFTYRPSGASSAQTESVRDQAALTERDLCVLSRDWLEEFLRTVRKGRSTPILNLIDQIRPDHVDLSVSMEQMVRVHQFDRLISVTEGALKQKVHGS